MSDEGFHEIQLGGKQLVFLFMAAAVVAVVLFLAGVMVGRGVRNEKAALTAQGPAVPVVDLAPASAEPAPPAASGVPQAAQPSGEPSAAQAGAPPAAPPPPVADDIQRPATKPEVATAAKAPAAAAALAPRADAASARGREPDAKPATTTPPAKPGPAATAPTRAPSTTPGAFSVQVAAPRDRASAAAIAKRLVAKGYPAYIVEPTAGSAPIYYRVRVGPFKSRPEAVEVERRLEKEEQFKPFITR